MSPEELEAILKLMRQYGAIQLKSGNIEVVLGPDPIEQKRREEELQYAHSM